MATGPHKIENRGGAREGAGRKPKTVSANQILQLTRTLKKMHKETGLSIYDILGNIIYGKGGLLVSNGERLAAIKLVMDSTIAKTSEKDVNITQRMEPSIYLPEKMADPSKIVAIAGGKK